MAAAWVSDGYENVSITHRDLPIFLGFPISGWILHATDTMFNDHGSNGTGFAGTPSASAP